MNRDPMTRRAFHRTTAATAAGLTALQASRVLGANERIRLGVIGVANRGGQLISAFLPHRDAEIAVLCDVAASTLDKVRQRLAPFIGGFRVEDFTVAFLVLTPLRTDTLLIGRLEQQGCRSEAGQQQQDQIDTVALSGLQQ